MSVIKNLNLNFNADQFSLVIDELGIPDEGVTAFWGPSGAGKTTLFKTLIGLYEPKGWSWTFKGESLSQLPISERRLGVVFQNYELFPHMTAEENIKIVMNARYSKSEIPEANKLLQGYKKRLLLEACWSTRADLLSGGEKQRVSLLRALMSKPRALLLDEPFSALDGHLRSESRELLKSVLKGLTIPAFLITHDREDVLALASHEIELKNGRVVTGKLY